MMQLAWPLVALVIGLAFAAVLAVHLYRRRELDEELQEDLGQVEKDVKTLQEWTMAEGHTYRSLGTALEGLLKRVQTLEDSVRALDQRTPGHIGTTMMGRR